MTGLINRIVDSAHGLVQQRQKIVGYDMVHEAAMQQPKCRKIAMPRRTRFYFPHLRRTTPWGGFLHMSSSFPDLMRSLCNSRPPFLAIDTDYAAFGGSPFDTVALRTAYSGVILVRDFTLSSYQVDEAKACGADGLIFPSWAWSAEGTPMLVKACRSLGMHAFYQVSSVADIEKMEIFDSNIVFVSWFEISKKLRQNDLQTMKALVQAIGPKRTVVVDGPWDPEENSTSFVGLECRGSSYADGLIGGNDACRRIDDFNSGNIKSSKPKEKPVDIQTQIENQRDEVWFVIANMQMTQPLLMPYPSEAEAARACTILSRAWGQFRMRQGARGDRPSGMAGVIEMPRGLHSALYVIDLDNIASIICVPAGCVGQA